VIKATERFGGLLFEFKSLTAILHTPQRALKDTPILGTFSDLG
jgi:hypothetical protein